MKPLPTALNAGQSLKQPVPDPPAARPGRSSFVGRVTPWYRTSDEAAFARIDARAGGAERAIRRLESIVPAVEESSGWIVNYIRVACDAAETLWLTDRTDYIETIERNMMFVRRGEPGDIDRAAPLLDTALAHFRAFEMTSWIRRA